MILDLDLGNTRAKWRLMDVGGKVFAQDVADIEGLLDGRLPDVWLQGVHRVRIASVLATAVEEGLNAQFHSQLSLSPEMAFSTSICAGVTNAYMDPRSLGVDRWLALVAAYKMCNEAVMVIDAGTALKVDVVNDAAHHTGGYIIPGAILMEQSLINGTDRVRYEAEATIDSVMLGRDTRSCVQHGVAAALVGAILVALEQCKSEISKRPKLYITGGLGFRLKKCLDVVGIHDANFEPDLVLDGLAWALP